MTNKQRIYEIEITENGEFGRIMKGTCPDCGQEVKSVEGMNEYSDHVCKCGKYWSFEIYAEADK